LPDVWKSVKKPDPSATGPSLSIRDAWEFVDVSSSE